MCCQHRANPEKLLKFTQGKFFAFLWALQHSGALVSKGGSEEWAEMLSDQSFHLPFEGIHACFFGQLFPCLSGNHTSDFSCAGVGLALQQWLGLSSSRSSCIQAPDFKMSPCPSKQCESTSRMAHLI